MMYLRDDFIFFYNDSVCVCCVCVCVVWFGGGVGEFCFGRKKRYVKSFYHPILRHFGKVVSHMFCVVKSMNDNPLYPSYYGIHSSLSQF